MRWRMWRRSVSSWVSPGPRVPMGLRPPPAVWRTRWLHMPERRGSRYWYWASSTCSLPSLVLARSAKISRIKALRSMTRHCMISSSALVWDGEISLSNTSRSTWFCRTSSAISRALPSPMKVRGSGVGRFCMAVKMHWPPAVSSSCSSSAMVSLSEWSKSGRLPQLKPTRPARSGCFSCISFCSAGI